MNFLKKLLKSKNPKTGIIFIVEDNQAYAKTLESFLKSSFPTIKEIKIFPVGETCLEELDKNPDLIIMDYFLDSKYYDAETGLETIKKIRLAKAEMNIVVLSSQNEIDVVIEAVKQYSCSYVKKDANAFSRLEEIVREVI
jgi:two-component system OmpR family response regulator